jgi:mRNA interferase MazF
VITLTTKNGNNFPRRGEIYWVSLDPTVGNETKKRRPALIVSNDTGNELTNIVIIAPITSNVARVYKAEAELVVDGRKAKIMLQQCRAIDKSRLGKKIDRVSREVMQDVERALKIVFDLI